MPTQAGAGAWPRIVWNSASVGVNASVKNWANAMIVRPIPIHRWRGLEPPQQDFESRATQVIC